MAGDVAINPVGSRALILPLQPPDNGVAAPSSDAPVQTAVSKRPLLNPSLHVDLALNLVVLQFEDEKGNVTNSIPSAKQLKAYRERAAGPEVPNAQASGPQASGSQDSGTHAVATQALRTRDTGAQASGSQALGVQEQTAFAAAKLAAGSPVTSVVSQNTSAAGTYAGPGEGSGDNARGVR